MALDRAPGLNRKRFGFHGWAGHDEDQWRAVRSNADERAATPPAHQLEIRGYDGDMQAVRRCQDNIGRLGLEDIVRIRCKDLALVSRPTPGFREACWSLTRLGGAHGASGCAAAPL